MNESLNLYEKIADRISGEISGGAFYSGDRLYSIREASERFSVSMSTVIQAYRLLEDRGEIEARPQSGFYVRKKVEPHHENDTCSQLGGPSDVVLEDLAMRVIQDSANPSLIQFGAALPDPELLPFSKMSMHLSSVSKDLRYVNLYGNPEGVEELRVQISKKSHIAGTPVQPDDIIVTNGCMEGVYIALSVLCRPGDLVAVESPVYFYLFKTFHSLGLRLIEIPTHRKHGVSIEALRLALEYHPVRACLFITNFNNPLGHFMPDENKRELAELIAEKDIPLIEDDTWGDMYFTDKRPRTVRSFDRSGNVILCSSFSKIIGPSFRIGWVSPGKWMKEMRNIKLSLNVGTSVLPQLAVSRLLATGGYEHILRTQRKAYFQKMKSFVSAIRRHFPRGTRVSEPDGGFVLWVELPLGIDSVELYHLALEKGISIAPGTICSMSGSFTNCIRLNSACWREEDEPAVKMLGRIAAGLLERSG
ncbi:MAG TPA: PLP-dependent aminotransferase family protein [Spirochaetota bacterium]|nr:PLP-dependent aminotransferase family protein [Spirochaetota bacterium]HPJ34657.1 PLP-dependent aminotransferase family protein [Spirochaetota bacterium]